jgi:Cu(I)/Ag(I) efflux system membrane protein CusA/SilA
MISWCIRNPLLVFLATLGIAVAGMWAWQRVPVDAIPDLSDNQVIVWSEWPGKSPEDVDLQVTSRLARELQGLPGVQTVRGLSLSGSSYVYVIFDERRNLYECRTRVLERLSQSQGLLPAGVASRLGPDATAMGQVFAFSLAGQRDVEAKRFVLDQIVVPALRAVPGVAEVASAGGVVREYQIDVDPTRLEEQAITLDMLMMAVQKAGRDVGAMSVEQSGVETMIRGVGFIRSSAEIENIVLRADQAQRAGLRLKDVASVTLGGAVRQGLLADADQEQAGAIVAMRVHEDPSAVIRAVKHRLMELRPALQQEQLTAIPFYDRSQLISETSRTLIHTLIEELIVTALVVVVFLLHARASLTVALVLPLGVAGTFLVMWVIGVGANLMTLAGIAIAIGVMVDFAIVMTENITQHLCALKQRPEVRKSGSPEVLSADAGPDHISRADAAGPNLARDPNGLPDFRTSGLPDYGTPTSPFDPGVIAAVTRGANEVARPLVTAAATTIVGFLPIFVLDDQAGRLFVPLAVTKTLAIAAAVVFGMLLVPVLCRFLLPPWETRRPLLIALCGLAAGLVGVWIGMDGLDIPRDHGRWSVHVPGWLAGPIAATLAALVVWRLGAERLVDPDHNAVARGIHIAYEWALTRLLRHKLGFALAIVLLASSGWLIGFGWRTMSVPLAQGFALVGGDLRATRLDAWLSATFPGLGSSFLPPLDEGSLLFMPSLPAGAGLGETQRVMATQNRAIADVPEVATVMGKMGRAETALDPAPIGMIETVVVLKPYREWPVQDINRPDGTSERRPRTLAEVRALLAAVTDIPGVAPSWLQPIETRVVMLSTGIRSPLALQLRGDDHAALEHLAERIEPLLRGVRGAADVQMQREGGKPYAELRLDSERLARFGLSVEQVMQAVEVALGGMPLAWSIEGTQRYGVRVRYARERRDDHDEIDQVQVPRGNGQHGAIPLSLLAARPVEHDVRLEGIQATAWLRLQSLSTQRNATLIGTDRVMLTLPAGETPAQAITRTMGTWRVAATRPADHAFTYVIGPMAIRSEGAKRTQYVLLRAEGRGEVDVIQDADALLRRALADGSVVLPSGVTWRWVGRYEQQVKAATTMRWVLIASVGIMLLLIVIGTRSWLVTGIIVGANLSVTTAGGFIAVWLAGAEMTTAVAVGFLVLLGVMFNDGILLGTYLHDQFKTLPKDVADAHRKVFLAGVRRRRPALMTNCTTLLALIPVLWSDGRGAEVMRPMVLPVIGGMVADLISLFSVPVFYAWFWEWRLRRTSPKPPLVSDSVTAETQR